jgi:hypothetical protein
MSDMQGISFKGSIIDNCKFRKGDLTIERLLEARSAKFIVEVDENGVETLHPGCGKLVREYGRQLPNYVLKGEKGYFDRVISQLPFDPIPIYIRNVGGWWAKVSDTTHRRVQLFRNDWYDYYTMEPEQLDPKEKVRVILL